MYGRGGIGKGRMISGIIAEVTNAGATVITVMPEYDAYGQVRPRLEAAGADLSRVIDMTTIGGCRLKLAAGTKEPGHLQLLAAAVDDLNKSGHYVQLIVIDPLAAVALGTISTNRGARCSCDQERDVAGVRGFA